MKIRRASLLCLLLSCFCLISQSGRAAVVILANRTNKDVRFSIEGAQGKKKDYVLEAGALLPIPTAVPLKIDIDAGDKQRHYHLDPDTAHFFGAMPDGLDLQQIGLGEPNHGEAKSKYPEISPQTPSKEAAQLTIRVKVLVDDKEPALQKTWEDRLRKRIDAASAILEKTCGAKLKVTAIDTWQSDDKLLTFREQLRDFEKKVRPDPADLSIGFMSRRCDEMQGPRHLGGTRYAFHPQILVREYMPRTEPERLEVLVHELGHYLGAVHSPEGDSVMRPNLGDGKSPAKAFRIGFDPANALVMNLMVEARAQGVKNLIGIAPTTRERLTEIYSVMGKTLPQDESASKYIRALKGDTGQTAGQVKTSSAVVQGTRTVMAAIVKAADSNRRRPAGPGRNARGAIRLSGDKLTEYYIRSAALAAKELPKEQAASAFLLGIGLAIDDSTIISQNPLTRDMCRQIESDDEREYRLEVLGSPTMDGRRDSCQHFVVSCALNAMFGAKLAESAGIFKEQMDMQPGGSGFSFADLAADFSGVEFASLVKESEGLLVKVAESFAVKDCMVPMKDWEDGLSRSEFTKNYGSVLDERFLRKKEEIYKKIHMLPVHEKKKSTPKE